MLVSGEASMGRVSGGPAKKRPRDGAGAKARDKLLLHGLQFFSYHGVADEERSLGQKFIVDVELGVDLKRAGQSDDIDDTVNYAAVYASVKDSFPNEHAEAPLQASKLVEHVAEDIAEKILRGFHGVEWAQVTVKKPHVAVGGIVDYLGVQILRTREDDYADEDLGGSIGEC